MKRLYERVIAAEAVIAAVFLLAMVLLIFAAGVTRLFGYPINWAVDVATCLFAWAVFFCADIAWRRGNLMSIEVVTSRLPPRLQAACRLLNYLIISAFLLYAIVMGLWLSWISRERSFQGMPEVSYSWVTMAMPEGAALLLATTALKARAELAR
ncbi:MAG: TRAP transporter small permease [Betaproteobacteria bacterium]